MSKPKGTPESVNVEALRGSAEGKWEHRGQPKGFARPFCFGSPVTHEQLRAERAARVKAAEDAEFIRKYEKGER